MKHFDMRKSIVKSALFILVLFLVTVSNGKCIIYAASMRTSAVKSGSCIPVRENIALLEKLVEETEKLQGQPDKGALKGKYEEIVKASDEILKINTASGPKWQVIYYKGMALHGLDQNGQAESVLKEAADKSLHLIEKNKDIRDNELAGIYYYLGRIQMMKKDTSGAVEYLKKALNREFNRKYSDKLQKDTLYLSIKNTDEYYNLIGMSLMIDQRMIWTETLVENGVVLASGTEIAESLGAKVEWEEVDSTLKITKFDKAIILQAGSKIAKVNGMEAELKAAPMIDKEKYENPDLKDDSILVPIEFVARELGQRVSYEDITVVRDSTRPAIVIREDESRVKYTEEQKKWAIAPSTNINLKNYGVYNVMGGNYRFRSNVLSIKDALEDGWGIYDRGDYFRILEWLGKEGHTLEYRKLEAQLSGEALKQIQDMVKGDEEVPFILKFYLNNKEDLKNKGLIAWDYCRIIQVTGWSYIAGYITIEEAYDICMEAARVLQKTYSSWEDMSEHYMKGFEFWSQQDRNDESAEAYYRNKINQYILKDEKSPFTTLPWSLKLD